MATTLVLYSQCTYLGLAKSLSRAYNGDWMWLDTKCVVSVIVVPGTVLVDDMRDGGL